MTPQRAKADDTKHELLKRGFTLKQFAEEYGFKYRDVSDVVRGIRFGKFGVGRDIQDKINEILQQPIQSEAA
jgi:gp16 family phage-associated protein